MKYIAFALTLLGSPLLAQDLTVQFADSAATQHISVQAAGCDISNAILMIDLNGSQGSYHFDAAEVEPVEITHGYGALSPVRNGDTNLQLLVHSLGVGDTLDLEAALAGAGDAPQGSAGIAGASVRLALSDRVISGTFDTQGTAKLALPVDDKLCLAAAD